MLIKALCFSGPCAWTVKELPLMNGFTRGLLNAHPTVLCSHSICCVLFLEFCIGVDGVAQALCLWEGSGPSDVLWHAREEGRPAAWCTTPGDPVMRMTGLLTLDLIYESFNKCFLTGLTQIQICPWSLNMSGGIWEILRHYLRIR